MMEQNKHIDEEIRRKLENLEAGYDPSSWGMLAHRMDYEAQQELDDIVKDRLEGVDMPVPPGSWDTLEQLIEAEEVAEFVKEEGQADHIAYHKLHNLRVPYDHHHWALMAKRLEEEFSIRHKIYQYKLAEVALVALLLLTIIRFAPLVEGWLKNEPAAPPLEQQHPGQPIAEGKQTDGLLSVHQSQPLLGLGSTNREDIWPDMNDMPKTGSFQTFQHNGALHGHPPVPPSNPSKSKTVEASGLRKTSTESPTLQPLPNSTLPRFDRSANLYLSLEEKAKELYPQEQLLQVSGKKGHPPMLLTTLSMSGIEPEYAWELPSVKIAPSKKKSDLRFSIFTATDFNYVTTPPNQITGFGEPVRTKYNETMAMGYGGGVNISWKKNRWEYQTGGIYSFKRYIPNTPIFIFETINFYVREDFNGIQLDILQLPFNTLYHFKNLGKWRLYTLAGLSTHFVTSTVYEIDSEREALNLTGGGSSPDDTKSIKKYKDFPEGLADGGKLRDNFYMSVNLGLGAEYYFSPRWTLFFQPNYQHFMMSGGIGTNKDKIYTTSLYLGTKFNLK